MEPNMSGPSYIPVPSPSAIHEQLFTSPMPPVPSLPYQWTASFLLTPFGGPTGPVNPSDQLVVANISYQFGHGQSLRARLYLLESQLYYDFYFETQGPSVVWYWLVSDPSTGIVTNSFGPFATTAKMPEMGILTTNGFSYIGSWNVVGSRCDQFSASPSGPNGTGTFYTFDAGTMNLRRVMNVSPNNDYAIAILGAYYFANVFSMQSDASDLAAVAATWKAKAKGGAAASPMLTQTDIQVAMMNPPPGAQQVSCSLADIQQFMPGISFPSVQPTPPAWTNQVQSNCIMVGQQTVPYYCQVYYDWTGVKQQITLTVSQTTPGSGVFDTREDDVLPKDVVGPSITYNYPGGDWNAYCQCPKGGFMPMSVPNFVEVGGGLCRAVFANNPYVGNMTIWSIALQDMGEDGDFWDWFDDQQNGVVFSLAPAKHLTLIDYQTFVRNASIDPNVWAEPTGLPQCPDCGTAARKPKLLPFVGSKIAK
jgi:hypothetical protein